MKIENFSSSLPQSCSHSSAICPYIDERRTKAKVKIRKKKGIMKRCCDPSKDGGREDREKVTIIGPPTLAVASRRVVAMMRDVRTESGMLLKSLPGLVRNSNERASERMCVFIYSSFPLRRQLCIIECDSGSINRAIIQAVDPVT